MNARMFTFGINNDSDILPYLIKNYGFGDIGNEINAYKKLKQKLIKNNEIKPERANLDMLLLSLHACTDELKQENEYFCANPSCVFTMCNIWKPLLNYISVNSDYLKREYGDYCETKVILELQGVEYINEENYILYCLRKFIMDNMEINIDTNEPQIAKPNMQTLTPYERNKLQVEKQIAMEREGLPEINKLMNDLQIEEPHLQPQSREVPQSLSKESQFKKITVFDKQTDVKNMDKINKLLYTDVICPKCHHMGRVKLKNRDKKLYVYHYGRNNHGIKTQHIIKNIDELGALLKK